MSAESGFSRAWSCGKYVCTLTMPKPSAQPGQPSPHVQHVAVEWEPDFPERLTDAELIEYQVGLDRALLEIAAEITTAAGLEI